MKVNSNKNRRTEKCAPIFAANEVCVKNRIAIVDYEKCQPHKCRRECERFCPVNLQSYQCITHEDKGQAKISEDLCTGCNICTKKCPFGAISIINLPTALGHVTHKYGNNGFQLHGLPMPEKDIVLALVGCNGIGKSTALIILMGELIPNMGEPDNQELTRKKLKLSYRGTNIQNYLNELDTGLKIVYKPQNVQSLRNNVKLVSQLVNEEYIQKLRLTHLKDRTCENLSDGELQRTYIGMCLSEENVDVLIFDEPCTYLDVYQRMEVARIIRDAKIKYKIVVEHDFMAVDYMADKVCILYGEPGCYGNVTMPMTTASGLNSVLDGFITYCNTRFRPYAFDFKFNRSDDSLNIAGTNYIMYPEFTIEYPGFCLKAEPGSISEGTVSILLGKNGAGKTSFINHLKIDWNNQRKYRVSYKAQNVYTSSDMLVQDYLQKMTRGKYQDANFKNEVMSVLKLDDLMERAMCTLSGGERQKVSIAATLGRNSDIYLIDEPSVYLDVEAVLDVAKILKRFAVNHRKYVFVVEHDLILGLYLADSVIVFESNGDHNIARSPMNSKEGFNKFLKSLDTTVRRDHQTFRPRINKVGSLNDSQQKQTGNYICADENISKPPEMRPIIDLEW